jgi:diguanylate cyclase (GGDEF)-like protein
VTDGPGIVDAPRIPLREKIRQLRLLFLGKLPGKVAEARDLLSPAGLDATSLERLDHVFHGLKGTAASFGLTDIARISGTAQTIISDFRDSPASPDGGTEALSAGLSDILDRITRFGETALATDEAVPSPAGQAVSLVDAVDERDAGRRVFLCDDDDLVGENLFAQLTCFGYEVVSFSTTEALRTACLRQTPDAVIMDIMFPHGRNAGTEVVATLQREMTAPPPVVFLSSRADFEARLGAVKAGGQAYFTKPVKVTDLVENLDALTDRERPEPYRILVVDDEPEVSRYHGAILEEAGMSVRLLHDPAGIIEVLTEFRPDLVLMDMYMPVCSGRELAQVIRQIPDFLSLPIVYLSNETDKGKQVSALRVGAEGFLTKPIQPDDLISAVAIRAERMRGLRALMVRDGLTGLFNHTFLSQYLSTTLAAAKREAGRVSLAMIDIDHFKMINDTYGHPAGDQVLVALSRLLQQRLRHSDLVGRYGGEEFVVIMSHTGAEDARSIIDSLREDFGRLSFRTGDKSFSCTFSGGVVAFPGIASEHLLETADQALYAAKRAGRNRVFVAAGKVAT